MSSGGAATERLIELADLSEVRPLTQEELGEAFDLSVGAATVEQLQAWLADQELQNG